MRPVFIGGCNRSGTTLLGSIIGTHSHCLCIPEMQFKFGLQQALEGEGGNVSGALNWVKNNWRFQMWGLDLEPPHFLQKPPSARDMIEWIVKEYGKHVRKPDPGIWVDHTPQNLIHAKLLVDLFPDARMIHIVRDGRAVASSLMRVDWGPNNIEDAANFWVDRLARAFAAELFWGPQRVMRVKYEDLVQEPEATLKKLCCHLDISYEPEMVQGTGFKTPRYTVSQHSPVGNAPSPLRVNAWEHELAPRQIEIFESIVADLLVCLGYPLQYGLGAKRIARRERFASSVHDFYRKAINWYRARRRVRLGLAHR